MRRWMPIPKWLLMMICALWLLGASNAIAAETTAAPVAPGTVDAQFWMAGAGGQAISIVSFSVGGSVQLPATVRIPVVTGMTVDWAGEISDSGDISQDIEREYTLKDGDGGQYVEMELSTFRVGQIDLSGQPMTVSGTDISATFEFVQSVPSDQTGFGVRFPAGASAVNIVPQPVGGPTRNEAGETLYALPETTLQVGEKQTVSVSYSTAGGGGGQTTTDPLDAVLWALVAAVVVAVIGLVWILTSRRPHAASETDAQKNDGSQYSDDADAEYEIDDRDDPFLVDD